MIGQKQAKIRRWLESTTDNFQKQLELTQILFQTSCHPISDKSNKMQGVQSQTVRPKPFTVHSPSEGSVLVFICQSSILTLTMHLIA